MLLLLIKYILKAALRDRLFISFIILIAISVSLSIFLGSAAVIETDQFSMVFAGAGLRLATNLMLILFVVFYIRRAFEARDIEYLLSRPITKLQFLFAHFFAFIILTAIASILVSLVIAVIPSTVNQNSLALWGISLWIELSIMVTVALFFALVLSSAVTSSLASFAFYVLARLIGDILGIIEHGASSTAMTILEKVMLVISIFIPRIDMMAQSAWLIYPIPSANDLTLILSQGIIFIGFVLAAAYMDLNKRQF